MKNTIIKMLEELGADVVYTDFTDVANYISVDIDDFEGFDENWREVERELNNPQKVDDFIDFLENNCFSKEGDFYTTYHFDGFNVKLGYTSYDI